MKQPLKWRANINTPWRSKSKKGTVQKCINGRKKLAKAIIDEIKFLISQETLSNKDGKNKIGKTNKPRANALYPKKVLTKMK